MQRQRSTEPTSDDNASASDNYAGGEQNGASENNGEEETLQVLTTKETEDQSPADALVDNDTIATNEATSEPAAGNNNDDDDGEKIRPQLNNHAHPLRFIINPSTTMPSPDPLSDNPTASPAAAASAADSTTDGTSATRLVNAATLSTLQ